MTTKVLKEILYLTVSFFMTLIFAFLYGFVESPNKLMNSVFLTEMKQQSQFVFFLSISIFLVFLIRQLKNNFASIFQNTIILITCLILFLFFNIFSDNTDFDQLTVKGNSMIIERKTFESKLIVFRCVQTLVTILSLYIVVKSWKKVVQSA